MTKASIWGDRKSEVSEVQVGELTCIGHNNDWFSFTIYHVIDAHNELMQYALLTINICLQKFIRIQFYK